MAQKFAAVGWQGIMLEVPEDWNLVGVSGDEKKGYFRVDGPFTSAVEVRWSHVKDTPDLEKRAREFLETVEKDSRKKKVKFQSKIKERKPSDSQFRTSAAMMGFNWKGDRNGYGALMYCALCKRLVIAQVISPVDEDLSALADKILSTISDHSDEGWTNWALYDLQTAVPSEFKLEKQVLMSAYVMLSFKSKYSEIFIERWGLANTLLKRMDIVEWFRKDSQPDYREFKLKIERLEEEDSDHTTIKVSGRRRGIKQMVRAALRAFTLRPLPMEVITYAWHCPESNRLFAVKMIHNGPSRIMDEVRSRTKCH